MQEFNVNILRKDFPILTQTFYNKPLIYLDNAATSQKPQSVLNTLQHFYAAENANVHRGLYALANLANRSFLLAREKIQKFINAENSSEIIFLRGTTEAINLVAQSFGRTYCLNGDEILISAMEHHSNIVPWQILGEQIGTKISVVPITDQGELDLEDYKRLLMRKPKLVAITHVSNVLGTINPVKQIIALAHDAKVPVLLDGAQAVPHIPVDVRDLDCDFYAFSGHKMYGPTGIGVLYGKKKFLEEMRPYQGGGGMIQMVDFAKTTYADLPDKFEAGTPNIAGAIGLGSAIDYLQRIGINEIEKHEQKLLNYATSALNEISDLKIIGPQSLKNKTGVISFVMKDIHPHDIGTILDREGISVRAGHHCAMPTMRRFNIPATVRISFGLYNIEKEVDALVQGIAKTKRIFLNG
jgi:cysteine desulfurase / selenocysteine lyase